MLQWKAQYTTYDGRLGTKAFIEKPESNYQSKLQTPRTYPSHYRNYVIFTFGLYIISLLHSLSPSTPRNNVKMNIVSTALHKVMMIMLQENFQKKVKRLQTQLKSQLHTITRWSRPYRMNMSASFKLNASGTQIYIELSGGKLWFRSLYNWGHYVWA